MKRSGLAMTIALVTAALPALAHADKPTIEEAKTLVVGMGNRFQGIEGRLPADQRDAAVAALSTPFWYDGLTFAGVDQTLDKECKQRVKKAGTVKEAGQLGAFVECLAISSFGSALDPGAEWKPVNLKRLPRVFKRHRAKLSRLAKDHTLVIAHFTPAGPAESWELYAVKRSDDGKPRLAAVLVVGISYAE